MSVHMSESGHTLMVNEQAALKKELEDLKVAHEKLKCEHAAACVKLHSFECVSKVPGELLTPTETFPSETPVPPTE